MKKSNNDWNVIVEADQAYVKLLMDRKRQTIKSVFFGPAAGGLVRPFFDGDKVSFQERVPDPASPGRLNDGARYEWLGEMKPMQAQRIVQNLTNNIARIGLDEFEWQRLQSPPT